MFEFDQDLVQQLLGSNGEFRSLHDEHETLKARIHDAEQGVNPVDDLALGKLKKQKLLTKDKMAAMIEAHRTMAAAQQ